MKSLTLALALSLFALNLFAADPHAGHPMPADPHAGHKMANPHEGHAMPADPHAGHAMGGMSAGRLSNDASTAVHIEAIHSYPTIKAVPGAVYATFTNTAAEADQLLSVSTPAAKTVEIHQTSVNKEGVARMDMVKTLPLPAGQAVKLERGGTHLMLIGLKANLAKDEIINLTFEFQKAGKVTVKVPVWPLSQHSQEGFHH